MTEAITQANFIVLEDQDTQTALELFPDVWQAAEQLLSPDVQIRHRGLDSLLVSQAPRISPLIAYLVVTRLFDPDEGLRIRVVEAIANILRRDMNGQFASEAVRAQVITGLSQLGDRGLYSLIEIGIDHEECLGQIAKLINYAPHTGGFLEKVAGDRAQRVEIRRLAVQLLGKIGYVEAYAELQRIRNRIESRQFGQKSMPFVLKSSDREELLLPELKKALTILGS